MSVELIKDITNKALHVQGEERQLTKAQNNLLKQIRECVEKQKPFNWDIMVQLYYDNVRKTKDHGLEWRRFNSETYNGQYTKWETFDVLEEYKKNSQFFKWFLRPLIRSWFLTNIGILVLKNKLIVIPTIDIE